MIKLYDRVTSKKTGLPAVGVVKVVADGEYLANWQGRFKEWDKLYPDWTTKRCYFVEFDKPQKPCSLDEVIAVFHEKDIYDENEINMYYENMPLTKSAVYPEDDLELME